VATPLAARVIRCQPPGPAATSPPISAAPPPSTCAPGGPRSRFSTKSAWRHRHTDTVHHFGPPGCPALEAAAFYQFAGGSLAGNDCLPHSSTMSPPNPPPASAWAGSGCVRRQGTADCC